jgi:hypothetical protein
MNRKRWRRESRQSSFEAFGTSFFRLSCLLPPRLPQCLTPKRKRINWRANVAFRKGMALIREIYDPQLEKLVPRRSLLFQGDYEIEYSRGE